MNSNLTETQQRAKMILLAETFGYSVIAQELRGIQQKKAMKSNTVKKQKKVHNPTGTKA